MDSSDKLPGPAGRSSTVLFTRLSAQECADRLGLQLGSAAALPDGRMVLGSVDEHGATLRRRITYRNSFKSIMKVNFIGVEGGTRLDCRFGMCVSVRIFLAVWFAMLFLIGGAAVLSGGRMLSEGAGASSEKGWAGMTIPILMGVFGLSLVRFGRSLARADEEFLVAFLAQITRARALK